MALYNYDGLRFHYLDSGAGRAFVFQHGLGGDAHQPAELYRPQPGWRFLALDCRGHGDTRPLGPVAKLSFAGFAADVLAWLDHLGVARAVVGGISMGAGVALNLALKHPERVAALVLARPAWLDRPSPPNLAPMRQVARLIREHGARRGAARFLQSAAYAELLAAAPEVARSLAGQFESPRAEETVAKLARLAADTPCPDRAAWAGIRVPTLVLATQMDPLHPFEYGATLASAIPGAVLVEVAPKSVSRARHTEEMQAAIAQFLTSLQDPEAYLPSR